MKRLYFITNSYLIVFIFCLSPTQAGPLEEAAALKIQRLTRTYRQKRVEKEALESIKKTLITSDQESIQEASFQRLTHKFFQFLAPNEHHQKSLEPFLRKAPVGAYIGVGTDRAFMAAAMLPKVTTVYLTDESEQVILFNRINIALLALAIDREDYRKLRLEPIKPDGTWLWDERLRSSPFAGPGMTLLLKNPVAREFWTKNVTLLAIDNMMVFHIPPTQKRFSYIKKAGHPFHEITEGEVSDVDPIAFANYIYEDRYFYPLQKLARERRIQPIPINLDDPTQIDVFFDSLKTGAIQISVLDLSNAWWEGYITRISLAKIFERFKQASEAMSLLIFTDMNYIQMNSRHFEFKPMTLQEIIYRGEARTAYLRGNFHQAFCYKLFESWSFRQSELVTFVDSLIEKMEWIGNNHMFKTLEESTQLNLHLNREEHVSNMR